MSLQDLKRKCCTVERSAKIVMFCLSVLFFCATAALMYLGIEMFAYMGNIHGLASNYFLTAPATVAIGLSILFLAVGITGLLALTRSEAVCLKRMFFALLLIIVVMEITGAALAIIFKDEVSMGIEKGMNTTMMHYEEKDNYKKSMDYIQSHLDCCGAHNYQDWFGTPWGQSHPNAVPQSCCRDNATANCTGAMPDDQFNVNHNGCHDELYEDIREYLVYIIVIAVFLFLFEALALCCTCYLVCTNGRNKQYQQLQTDKFDSSYGYKA